MKGCRGDEAWGDFVVQQLLTNLHVYMGAAKTGDVVEWRSHFVATRLLYGYRVVVGCCSHS